MCVSAFRLSVQTLTVHILTRMHTRTCAGAHAHTTHTHKHIHTHTHTHKHTHTRQDGLKLRERLKKEFELICEDQEELRTRSCVCDAVMSNDLNPKHENLNPCTTNPNLMWHMLTTQNPCERRGRSTSTMPFRVAHQAGARLFYWYKNTCLLVHKYKY